VSAIGAFSTHGVDLVCLVNSAILTGQSYFRNLSCVTPEYKLPAAPANQTSQEKSVEKEHLERLFAGAALSIIKPTAICALFKFKEVPGIFSTNFDLAHSKLSVRALLNGVKTVNISTPINLGILLQVYRDITEPLYVNRGRYPDWQY
jgi:hypothetical protein